MTEETCKMQSITLQLLCHEMMGVKARQTAFFAAVGPDQDR
jgi:hypothetical protein